MQVHVTNVQILIGKKDQKEWLKVSYLNDKGEAASVIMPKPDKIPELDITPEELAQYDGTDIQFNERGRVQSIG